MRFLWAGLIVLISSSPAWSQATGYVRDVGFAGFHRPDAWTPMLVHLDSTFAEPAEYQIQVHQQDLDQDTVVYRGTVTLGPQAHENYWIYFKPQPTDGGLPGPGSVAQLGDVLKVRLYDKAGNTLITNLPVQTKVENIDPGDFGGGAERAVKMVLVVMEAGNYHAQEFSGAQGVIENVLFVPVRVDALPDHEIGYSAIDAVLWLDASFNSVRNSPAFTALQNWVRGGGNMVVCQPADRTQLEALASADMLPVVAKTGASGDAAWAIQVRQAKNLEHLKSLARYGANVTYSDAAWKAVEAAHPSFEVAFATPQPDAMVDAWIDWPIDPATTQPADDEVAPAATNPSTRAATQPALVERSPLIARRAYGTGSVAWVAQNLGAGVLDGAPDPNDQPPANPPAGSPPHKPRVLLTNGWPRIWDRVFGWRNQSRTRGEVAAYETFVKNNDLYTSYERQYAPGGAVDLGFALLNRNTEHGARSTAYVFVAVLFFVGYWVIAGPVSYLFLASKGRRGLSWTVFGASAVVAALLTTLLVQVLLRGGPEAKHLSLVRMIPAAPAEDGSPRSDAVVHTTLGLYIPSDGEQTVTIGEPAAEGYAAVSPYAVHPHWLKASKDAGFTDTAKYFVDTDPIVSGKSASVGFPYRSTAKKIDAQWSGSVNGGIVGAAKNVLPSPDGKVGPLTGVLTNNTGRDLIAIHFVFTDGWVDAAIGWRTINRDFVMFVPVWKNGTALDLAAEYGKAAPINKRSPGAAGNVFGGINAGDTDNFSKFWYSTLRPGLMSLEDTFDDSGSLFTRSFPIISLIDRIGPMRQTDSSETNSRPELVRRGVRDFDASSLVAAGKLLILAHAKGGPLPLPIEVNESELQGDGVTFYQIALPLDRSSRKPAE